MPKKILIFREEKLVQLFFRMNQPINNTQSGVENCYKKNSMKHDL